MRDAVTQYLERHAEPEARLAAAIDERYTHAWVVPAYAESPQLLAGYAAAASALSAAGGNALLVLVVNAPDDACDDALAATSALWSALAALPGRELGAGAQHALWRRAPAFDVLAIDRWQGERRVPRRQGVGLARRAGMDCALALWQRGQLACHAIGSSDADVELSADYFAALGSAAEAHAPGTCAAWLLPFSHVAGGEPAIDDATWTYEAGLRYYVLGLAYAGSPYAYHSIGSTFAVDARAYAGVRGFPKRAAGEDFYLLDKLAKVAPLRRSPSGRVSIRARRSERVPFGTGRRALAIAAHGEPVAYHPQVFLALRALLRGLDAFAADAAVEHVQAELRAGVPELSAAAQAVLGAELEPALRDAASQAPRGAALRRRVHTWFDALRTLRFIHGLRDAACPSLPLARALASAEFVGAEPSALEPRERCAALERLERAAPAALGPALRA